MGSLVPGWDAAASGVPPRELQEIDEGKELMEGPQRESYFAKLEKSKSLRRASVGADGLQRASSVGSPSNMTSPLLQHSATLPAHTTTSPRTLQHSATTTLARHTSPAKAPYVATDWEAEIHALQGKESRARASLGRRSVDSNVSSTTHSAHQQPAWWAMLDTGALNRPTMQDNSDAAARASIHDRAAQPEQAGGAAHALKGVKLDWVGSHLH